MNTLAKALSVTTLLISAVVFTIVGLRDGMNKHKAYLAESNSGQVLAFCERVMKIENTVGDKKLTDLRDFCQRTAKPGISLGK